MITISRLTEKDLDVYKGKKVYIYGYEIPPNKLYNIFKKHDIDVIGCWCEHKHNQSLRTIFSNIPYIEPNKIDDLNIKKDKIIVQGTDFDNEFIKKTQEIAGEFGWEYSDFSEGYLIYSFGEFLQIKKYKNLIYSIFRKTYHKVNTKILKNKIIYDHKSQEFIKRKPSNPIIICSPMKTADHTLNFTFDKVNNDCTDKINYINLTHKPRRISKNSYISKLGKIKIIVGIRNPIEQNLSQFYQVLSSGLIITAFSASFFRDSFKENKKVLKMSENILNGKENIDVLWNQYILKNIYNKFLDDFNDGQTMGIQQFMIEFQNNVLDITKLPI